MTERRRISSLARRLALGVALLTACGDATVGDGAHDETALVRLWRDGTPAGTVAGEHAVGTVMAAMTARAAGNEPAPLPGPAGGDGLVHLATRFEATDDTNWYAVIAAAEGMRYEPVAWDGEARPGGALAHATSVDVVPGEALRLRVVVRAAQDRTEGEHDAASDGAAGEGVPGDAPPLVVVVQRRDPFDPGESLDPAALSALLTERNAGLNVGIAGRPGAETQSFDVEMLVGRLVQQVLVFLVTPVAAEAPALVFEELTLWRRPLADYVAGGGLIPRCTPLAGGVEGAVRWRMDQDEREGLLAVPGSSYRWTLGPSPVARRLDLALGVAPRDPSLPGAVDFAVRWVDGEQSRTLLDEHVTPPSNPSEPAWRDRSLIIPPAEASSVLVLETSTGGEQAPLAAWGHPTLRSARSDRRPNVLLVSLDTLRADRLGCYGGPVATPHLDSLAAQGLRFARGYATSSWTLPSHASLMTGQYPAYHGAVDMTTTMDATRSPILAQQLAAAGYATAAFTAGGFVSTDFGFGAGFDRYSLNDPVWALETLRGRELLTASGGGDAAAALQGALLARYDTGAVTDWIAGQQPEMPFFAFVHTYIVHNYAPGRTWLEDFELLDEQGRERPFDHRSSKGFNDGRRELRDEARARYLPYYDATVAMADAFVGELLQALEQAGLAEDTLVIVTSDHGEEFGEHDHFGHGRSLYEPATRIPLIARGPGLAPAVVDMPVSLVDVAPWILRRVGLTPDPRMEPAPPLGAERTSPPGRRRVVLDLSTGSRHQRAYVEDDLKLLQVERVVEQHLRGQEGTSQLFDLSTDALEGTDLAPQRSEDVARLARALRGYEQLAEALRASRQEDELDPATLESLRQLGYVDQD